MALEIVQSADGTKISFERSGKGHPLVLVHGSGADRHRFDALLPHLEEQFELLNMDRRGRGESEDPKEYDIAREAEDIVSVAGTSGSAAHVMGYSYGGLCALEALKLPNNFHKVVLFEPPISLAYDAEMSAIVQELSDYVSAGETDSFVAVRMQKLLSQSEEDVEMARADKKGWAARKAGAALSAREMQTIHNGYVFEPDAITLPDGGLEFLVGSDTIDFLKAGATGAHAALSSSELTWLPGLTHSAATDEPRRFAQHLKDCLLNSSLPDKLAV